MNLSLTGAPAGTTPGAGLVSSYTFPSTATFPSTWTYPLSISAARTTPTGTSAPFIGASGDGFNINSTTPPSARVGDGLTQAAKVILRVSPSSGGGNFALAANPSSLAVKHGNSTSSTITVTPSGGFTSSVSLQATLSPSNGNGNPTISFGTNPVQAGSGASVMTVTTSSKTHTGKYDITVTGTSGSTRHSISVTLTVNWRLSEQNADSPRASALRAQPRARRMGLCYAHRYANGVRWPKAKTPWRPTGASSPSSATTTKSFTTTAR